MFHLRPFRLWQGERELNHLFEKPPAKVASTVRTKSLEEFLIGDVNLRCNEIRFHCDDEDAVVEVTCEENVQRFYHLSHRAVRATIEIIDEDDERPLGARAERSRIRCMSESTRCRKPSLLS